MTVQLGMQVVVLALAAFLAGGPGSATGPSPSPTAPPIPSGPIQGLSARLELPTKRLEAGSEVTATVVVENSTGADVTVGGCGSLFVVALGNANVDPADLVAWPSCLQAITIPAGTTRYPVPVAARYVACFGSSRPPICVDSRPPPLPPGRYEARLAQNPTVVAEPKPVKVRVTR